MALKYKFTAAYTRLHRCFAIFSDFSKFNFEVETLKKTFYKNAYSTEFVDKGISKFLNNTFVGRPVITTVPELELRIVLPYLGSISSITKTRLTRFINKRLKFFKISFIFQASNRLFFKYFFSFMKTEIKFKKHLMENDCNYENDIIALFC